MSQQNKQLVRRWFEEVWNEGRREVIGEMLAPDAVIQDGGEASVGPEGFYPSSTECTRRFQAYTAPSTT